MGGTLAASLQENWIRPQVTSAEPRALLPTPYIQSTLMTRVTVITTTTLRRIHTGALGTDGIVFVTCLITVEKHWP